jgi:hypothetical protein
MDGRTKRILIEEAQHLADQLEDLSRIVHTSKFEPRRAASFAEYFEEKGQYFRDVATRADDSELCSALG